MFLRKLSPARRTAWLALATCCGGLLLIFLSILPAPSAPPAASPPIHVSDTTRLQASVGQSVTLYGRVERTGKSGSGHQFLNFSNTGLSIVCLAPDVENFPSGAPADLYLGRDVEISGLLERYRDKLQIRLRRPSQIRIAQPPRSPPAQPPRAKEATGPLHQLDDGVWRSPAGLVYKGTDPAGLTRLEHVRRHTRDIPDREGPHGVFDGGDTEAFAVIDEAWQRAARIRLKPRVEGDRSSILVRMGRRVGFLGGREGARRNHPALTRVFIVYETGTKHIVTAFPR